MLLALPAGALAETAPVVVNVTSPASTDGSFGIEITGASAARCESLLANVTLEGATKLNFRAARACQYEATPDHKLVQGHYCISLSDFGGSIANRCFDLTGSAPEASAAQLALEPAGPDGWLPSQCGQCSDGSGATPCTRRVRQRMLRLTLNGVARSWLRVTSSLWWTCPAAVGRPRRATPS